MTLTLTHLGMVCLLGTVCFTWAAARGGVNPRAAIIEAWTNVVFGFSVNWCANWVLLPLVGAHMSGADNWWLGWIFTVISVLRQYVIRLWLGDRIHKFATRFGDRLR